jgi:chromosome partitioning protein
MDGRRDFRQELRNYVFKDGNKSRNQDIRMHMIIACIQSKGGVGKTTSAVNLGHALATQKQKVLLIDLDSQGSASLSLGVPRDNITPSITDVLMDDLPIEEAVRETSVKDFHIVTGSMALANFDVTLANDERRTERIKDGIKSIIPKFDTIILDCPPTMSLLPVNALVACDHYLVPVMPHYPALEGLVNLLDAIDRIKAGIGVTGSLLGILLTMVDQRAKVTTEISNIIRKQFQSAVFKTEIKTNIKLAEAPSFGKTIFQYDWNCTGAEAYQALAKEVIQRTKGKVKHEQTKTGKRRV